MCRTLSLDKVGDLLNAAELDLNTWHDRRSVAITDRKLRLAELWLQLASEESTGCCDPEHVTRAEVEEMITEVRGGSGSPDGGCG